MMLEYLGFKEASVAIERAVEEAVSASEITADIGGALSTTEAGEAIRGRIGSRQ
jgi:isocitrate/isopropylmalate dehydrogenase